MLKNGKWVKTVVWHGLLNEEECTNHSYSWSGKMPCTGIYRCVLCGKPKENN